MKLLLAVVVCLVAVSISARQVSCDGTQQKIDPNVARLYDWLFRDFVETQERQGKATLRFEAVAFLATVASSGVDLGEFLFQQRFLESITNSANVSLSEVAALWQSVWQGQAEYLVGLAPRKITRTNACLISSLYHRAAMYLQLSTRLNNQLTRQSLDSYQRAVRLFAIAASIEDCGVPSCKLVKIPYRDENGTHALHGYWCYANQGSYALFVFGIIFLILRTPQLDIPQTTIVAFSGYDGTAELMYHEVAVEAVRNGFNVLIFDGPGQGATARFSHLTFRWDWEVCLNLSEFSLLFLYLFILFIYLLYCTNY
jgi:hypothetical protein